MATIRQLNRSIYWAWKSMKQRCQNPKCKAYRNYGARGISVCDEWQEFEPFYEWAIENGYSKGLDLDRKDNDAGYFPENCRWISRKENVNNRRCTTYLTVNGKTLSRTEWEDEAGISCGTIKMWVLTHGKEYAESRIQDALKNGYISKDYGYSHRKRITHLETGKTFDSVREAANYFGISPPTISNSIRLNKPTRIGRFRFNEVNA